jgi:carboxypeptidase Q
VTPQSIESVHAGGMVYADNITKIPTAAITTEDADMFARMQKRNQTITVELELQNTFVSGCQSSNLVFEVQGSLISDEVILMGGHIDSWDTGSQTGANDDGGGFMTVYEAMRLVMKNGFRPKRTLRFIAWSGEEFGDINNGGNQYVRLHEKDLSKHIEVFESDEGSRKLLGFGFSGNSTARKLLKDISSKYLSLIGCDFIGDDGEEADSNHLFERGVPMIKNIVEDTPDQQFYFTYHHTQGDTISIMDPDQMDSNVLGIAVLTYIIADL